MKRRRLSFGRVCFAAGVLLILASVVMLVLYEHSSRSNAAQMQGYINILCELVPERRSAVMEQRIDNVMPSLNVNSEDFIAVMEIPSKAAVLPVGASWSGRNAYPCRYEGSVYDGSLVIGTTNQKGQFDFAKDISVGNAIHITDMTGDCFSFKVSDIRYSKHIDDASLRRSESDLTVFIKNIYSFEYIILYCAAFGS